VPAALVRHGYAPGAVTAKPEDLRHLAGEGLGEAEQDTMALRMSLSATYPVTANR
jgi:hypothetical protein